MKRIPPHSIEAEKSILGAMLLSADAIGEALSHTKEEDFYKKSHQEIFATIKEMNFNNQEVDITTLAEALKSKGSLEMVGGRSYIAELSSYVPSVSNAGGYGDIISEKAALRRLISVSDKVIDQCYGQGEPREIIEYAEKNILEAGELGHSNHAVHVKDIMMETLSILGERVKNKGRLSGVPSGFIDLDRKLNGFQKSDMIILAARPAMGKTAFSLNVVLNAALADSKNRVLFFSLEMSKEQLNQRLLSIKSGVNSEKLNKGEIDNEDWEKIGAANDAISAANIFIDDTPNISLADMKSKCRRIKAEGGLSMVVVDYLQLMQGSGGSDNRQQEVSNFSRGLKLIAREMNCPVIVLSQLSRAPEMRTNHRPMLSDLRESGAIEQDADIILFLYRDEVYREREEGELEVPESPSGISKCEVNVAKHRNGSTGVVELGWQGQYTRFVNLDRSTNR